MPEIIDSVTGETVEGAMETVTTYGEERITALNSRIAATIVAAERLSREQPLATITIHVGTGMWDYLQTFATKVNGQPYPARPLFYGFSIFREASSRYEPDDIAIRAEMRFA